MEGVGPHLVEGKRLAALNGPHEIEVKAPHILPGVQGAEAQEAAAQ